MIIRNMTPRVQELKIYELVGGREFTIYLTGGGVTEIQGAFIPNIDKLKGIIEIIDESSEDSVDINTPVEEIPVDIKLPDEIYEMARQILLEEENQANDIQEDNKDSESQIDNSEAEIAESKFICDICGAEFASARGLASHKSRAHLEEDK